MYYVQYLIFFSEYNNYYEGEFILYRHKTLPFAVSHFRLILLLIT